MNQLAEKQQPDNAEFVTFVSGAQNFCIEITQIREIRRWSPVAVLPHSPEHVLGIINLRGTVIPIYDLALRLGLGQTDQAERTVIIIVANSDQTIGLLVDSVSEILNVETDIIQEAPGFGDEQNDDCILGVISIDEDMTRVIDLTAVVQSEQHS